MKQLFNGLAAATLAFLPVANVPHPAQAQPAGTLNIGLAAEAVMVDPTRSAAGVDQYFTGQMFEQLLRTGPDLKTRNWLAESWDLTDDGGKPVITVKLRPGVKFHNGDPLTSADFEFAYRRQGDRRISLWSHLVATVESFEIIDDLSFRIRFKEPDGSFTAGNLILWAVPKRYIEQVGDEEFARKPVGTGPWKFVSRTVKEELRLEAFEDYWNKEARPTVKNVVAKIIPEDLTRVAAFKTGAIDWIDAVPPAMVAEFSKMPGVQTGSFVSPNNMYITMDALTPKSRFWDVRVRRAVAHAIDMDAIIKRVLFGQGQRYTQVGIGSLGYDPDLKPYPFDPRRARELLREAGFPNGFETPCYNLTTPREPYQKEMGEAVFAYITAVGIRCKIVGMEYGTWITFMRREREGHVDGLFMNMWGHGLPGDPGTPWAGHLHSFVKGTGWGSTSHHNDPKFDELVKQLKGTMDLGERDKLIRHIARLKHEEVAGGLPLYRPVVTLAWRDKVTFTPWPAPGFWRQLQQVGLKQ
jgi:peptide/nickel transport system substrate-binding protein